MENLEDLYIRLTTEGLEKRDYSRTFQDEGMRIETVMPSCFEGYAKIMIPWSINVDAPDKYFKEIKNWRPVTWKEVCKIYEAHYHNEISPFSFDYKFKGVRYGLLYHEYSSMPVDLITPLFEILKKHTKSNLLIWNSQRKVEEISIDKFLLANENSNLFSTHVTKKGEWMTYVGHESYCITIGGKYDLIDDLLKSKELEVLECTPLTRIDWHSDKIN